MQNSKKKLAYLTSRFPYPLDQGDKLRAYYQIKYLSQYYDIYLFTICQQLPAKSELLELDKYCKEIFVHMATIVGQIKGITGAILGKYPYQTGIHYDVNFDNLVINKLDEYKMDILYVQLIRMAEYAKEYKGLRIIDYMDAFSKSMNNRAKISSVLLSWMYRMEAKKVEKYELNCQNYFDGYVFIAQNDAVSLNLAEDDRSSIVSNGIDKERFYNDESVDILYDIGFIGNLGYPPNQDAVKCLVEEIVPAYEKKFNKKLSLLIAGARAPEAWKQYENDHVHIGGYYNDINQAYNQIAVFCAFYHSSTGQQNKVLEAMSAEVPVLCNTELNSAILASNEKEIVLADSINMLIDKLKILLENESKRKSIGRAASQLCKDRFQWDAIGYQLYLAIEENYRMKLKLDNNK